MKAHLATSVSECRKGISIFRIRNCNVVCKFIIWSSVLSKMSKEKKVVVLECQMFNCQRLFLSQTLLKRHMLYHAGVCPFMCVLCGTAFKKEYALKSHLQLRHDEHMDEKFKKIRGFVTCNMCMAMIPCREMKSHVAKTHVNLD